MVANRCAGYDRVDLDAAKDLGIAVARVPTYSPESVAEAGLCLLLATARNLRLASLKVLVGNYTLDGLVGTQLTGKTFGVIGTGAIGTAFIKLLSGFGGKILAYDLYPSDRAREYGAEYVEMDRLLSEADVISLHTPLLPSTKHIICRQSLGMMKEGSILINVSRGGLIDTESLVEKLVDGSCGVRGVGMDVYEDEESLFFTDFTDQSARMRMKSWDSKFQMLKSLPQVVITPHTAYVTDVTGPTDERSYARRSLRLARCRSSQVPHRRGAVGHRRDDQAEHRAGLSRRGLPQQVGLKLKLESLAWNLNPSIVNIQQPNT